MFGKWDWMNSEMSHPSPVPAADRTHVPLLVTQLCVYNRCALQTCRSCRCLK